MPDDKKKSQYRHVYDERLKEGLTTPKVQSLPYGERGEEAPAATPGTYDRMTKNPFEEEGFSHLRPHETRI